MLIKLLPTNTSSAKPFLVAKPCTSIPLRTSERSAKIGSTLDKVNESGLHPSPHISLIKPRASWCLPFSAHHSTSVFQDTASFSGISSNTFRAL
jgi:hypothetical protein